MGISLLLLWLTCLRAQSAASAQHTALSPLPDQAPPPEDALAWVEEVKQGWVMVWDLKDGERWLQALHPRAATSVKLWRLPDIVTPELQKAPFWMEGAPAYILAARERNIKFIFNTSKILSPHDNTKYIEEPKIFIDSTARTVIGMCNRMRGDISDAQISLREFWSRHSSFFALLVKERSANQTQNERFEISRVTGVSQTKQDMDQWDRYYFDPFEGVNGILHSVRGHLKPSELTTAIGRRFYDLGGRPMKILTFINGAWRCIMFRRPNGDVTFGADLRAIIEAARTINSINTVYTLADNVNLNNRKMNVYKYLRSLWDRTADILCQRISVNNHLPMVQAAWQDDGFFFLVPRAGPLPCWSLPLRGLHGSVWKLLAASMAVYLIAWYIVTGKPFSSCIADTLALFSTYGLPSESSTAHRFHSAGALLISSLVVIVLYQGRLFTITTEPENGMQISTLQDLADSNLPVVISNPPVIDLLRSWSQHAREQDAVAARTIYNIAKEGQGKKWPKERAEITDPDYIFRRLIFDGNIGKVLLKNYKIPYPVSLHASVNWPWRDVFSKRLRWTVDSGLYDKWVEMIAYDFTVYFRRRKNDPFPHMIITETLPRVLNISDLWPHFQILLYGFIISLIAFIFEIREKCFCRPDQS